MDNEFTLKPLVIDWNCLGGKCPTVFQGSDGEIYVQGYVVPEELKSVAKRASHEDIVRISPALLDAIKKL